MNIDLEVLKKKMLIKYPFFGSVLLKLKFKEDYNTATACTDGKTLYFNPNFMNSLSLDEQIFTFAHEVCHVAFNHILRSEGKIHKWWNIATDAVINAMLARDGLPQIEGTVKIEDALKYNAEQLYEKLVKENEKQQHEENQSNNDDTMNNGSSTDNNSNGSSEETQDGDRDSRSSSYNDNDIEKPGHDDHSIWGSAVEDKRREGNRGVDGENGTSQLSENEAFEENRRLRDEIRRDLERELQSSVSPNPNGSSYEFNSSNSFRRIDSSNEGRNLIDWRQQLRESIHSDVDWSLQDAEEEDGVVVSRLQEQPFSETEIVIDVSGSISETLIKNFLRECKYIFQNSRVKVGFFDTKFYGFQEVRSFEDIDNLKIPSGGGTDFEAAVSAFTDRVENKIIFTDGYASNPRKYCDAIWVVLGHIKINPPGGRTIYMSDKESNTLNGFKRGR